MDNLTQSIAGWPWWVWLPEALAALALLIAVGIVWRGNRKLKLKYRVPSTPESRSWFSAEAMAERAKLFADDDAVLDYTIHHTGGDPTRPPEKSLPYQLDTSREIRDLREFAQATDAYVQHCFKNLRERVEALEGKGVWRGFQEHGTAGYIGAVTLFLHGRPVATRERDDEWGKGEWCWHRRPGPGIEAYADDIELHGPELAERVAEFEAWSHSNPPPPL